jgi:AraC-like DNA-binding protein/mannose-6-phosphate isomerase-like protein (cupin superfamily)
MHSTSQEQTADMDIRIGEMEKARVSEPRVSLAGTPHVVDLGLVRDVPGHAHRLLEFWVFGIVLDGSMPMDIGGFRFTASPGDYYVIPEGVRHYGLDEGPFDAAFFHFVLPTEGTAPARVRPVELSVFGQLPQELEYEKLYRFLERHYRRGLFTSDQLGTQLLAILEQIAATQLHRSHVGAAASHELAALVMDTLRSSFGESLTGNELSKRFGYSYPHLERAFRASFGSSIHQELTRIRIDAASHSLQMGKSIKEVAKDVGFSDYYYFLKTFKKLRGITPASFRQSFQTLIADSGVIAAQRMREEKRGKKPV